MASPKSDGEGVAEMSDLACGFLIALIFIAVIFIVTIFINSKGGERLDAYRSCLRFKA